MPNQTATAHDDASETLAFREGRNCWHIAEAERMALIIDGQDYFRALRESLLKAQRLALMVGWDFDFDIEMLPGESDDQGNAPDGYPNRIGDFLEALVDERPELDIYLLRWSGGTLIAPSSMVTTMRVRAFSPEHIHLALDGHHPIGACHHQKIVVIDDTLAFCGGIDVTAGRWDSREHADGDARRNQAAPCELSPWHDAAAVMSGPAAVALSRLARKRWLRARGEDLPEDVQTNADLWPASIAPRFHGIDVAIARTAPPEPDHPVITEIETLYLDSIAAAKETIYLESQYFCAESIARAVAARLAERDGPEVVIINPAGALSKLENQAMHVQRNHFLHLLHKADRFGRLRFLYPQNASGTPIYVHAKISIIDDRFLRVGSSNLDRRSMGFDTEADIAIIARDADDRQAIAEIRDDLLAEHLGCKPEAFSQSRRDARSLIAAIDAMTSDEGRRLRRLRAVKEHPLGRMLAKSAIFDPRYRRSAQSRLGISTRHIVYGAIGVALIGTALGAAHSRYGRRRGS